MPTTAKQMIKFLKRHGFEKVSQSGSHQKFYNEATACTVIVPYHTGGRDLPLGTERNILKQAGLR